MVDMLRSVAIIAVRMSLYSVLTAMTSIDYFHLTVRHDNQWMARLLRTVAQPKMTFWAIDVIASAVFIYDGTTSRTLHGLKLNLNYERINDI